MTSAEELLNLLTAPKQDKADKQSKGMFLTTISFLPDSISFSPDTSTVAEELSGTVESIISIAQQVGECAGTIRRRACARLLSAAARGRGRARREAEF